jgi:transcriptional regulator with XRE-family HTH domain
MKGLGNRIQSLRKSRNLTLVQIARSTGIDQATLSRIENGKMTGTLDSHMRLAEVLGVRLPELYEEVLEKIHGRKERAAVQKIETFSYSSGAVAELLTSGILQKKMTPILLKIKPRGHTEREEYKPGTERFIYVLKGAVEISAGREKTVLKEGEKLYFNASLPHNFRNTGKKECQALSVMTPATL